MSTPADRLNRVMASAAATSSAARVTGKGEHWQPRKAMSPSAWQDTPVPILPLPAMVPDGMIGQRFGRLRVLGYGGKGSDCARWAVRCDCGGYGYQRAKMLRNAHHVPMCPTCNYADQVKRGLVFYDAHEKLVRSTAGDGAPPRPAVVTDRT